MKWLLLLVGGGIGAVLRFAIALWVDERVGVHFPWGTLAVNAVGCFGIGVRGVNSARPAQQVPETASTVTKEATRERIIGLISRGPRRRQGGAADDRG